MNDIIVVFGSVKSSTYAHLRLAMMRAGLKPKIVRVDSQHKHEDALSIDESCWDLAKKKESDTDSPRYGRILGEEIEKYKNSIFTEALPSDEHIKAVKAVILPHVKWGLDEKWVWFTSALGPYAEYTVQLSDDGGPEWLSGPAVGGFGGTLPPNIHHLY